MMRRSGIAVLVAAVLVMALGQTPASAQYDGYPYPVYGSPESLDRVGEVLGAIDSPSRRSALAENWLQFSKTAIAKNLELRDRWLNLQKEQLNRDQQVEQQRVDMARLQVQLEQLRAENLRLERENLQMRMSLNSQAAASGAGRAVDRANQPAGGTGFMSEPVPQTPPAGR
jgi:hypothetical protein